MATIPTYVRERVPEGLPNVRVSEGASPAAFGAAVGAGLEQLGDAGQRYAMHHIRMQEERDEIEALNLFGEYKKEVQIWHDDPESGQFVTRLGENSKGLAGDSSKWIAEKGAEYAGRLKTEKQRQQWARMQASLEGTWFDRTSDFEVKQFRSARENASQATVEGAISDVAADWQNEATFERSFALAWEANARLYEGQAPEVRERAALELRSQMRAVQLVNVLREDPLAARGWFEARRDDFPAEMHAKLSETIEQETSKKIAREATDMLWSRYGDDEEAARAMIFSENGMTDDQQEMTWSRYQARATDDRRFKSQKELEWVNSWYEQIGKAGSMEEAVDMIDQSGATGKNRLELLGIARQTHGSGKGSREEDDLGAYLQAYERIARGEITDPAVIVKEYGALLSPDTVKTLSKQVIDGSIRDELAVEGGDTAINNLLKDAKITDEMEKAQFYKVHADEVQRAQAEKGRKLSPAEKIAIAKTLLQDVVLGQKEGWWTRNVKGKEYQKGLAERTGAVWDSQMGKFVYLDEEDRLTGVVGEEPDESLSGEPYSPSRVDPRNYQPQTASGDVAPKKKWENLPPGKPPEPQKSASAAGAFVEGGGTITSQYGSTESFRASSHKGLDIAAAKGTPVTLPGGVEFVVDKVVTGKSRSGNRGDAGNYVKLKQKIGGNDVELTMMHLDGVKVAKGERVRPGDIIGGVGNTGFTVGKNGGYHLDVRVKVNGKYVDPAEFLKMVGG